MIVPRNCLLYPARSSAQFNGRVGGEGQDGPLCNMGIKWGLIPATRLGKCTTDLHLKETHEAVKASSGHVTHMLEIPSALLTVGQPGKLGINPPGHCSPAPPVFEKKTLVHITAGHA